MIDSVAVSILLYFRPQHMINLAQSSSNIFMIDNSYQYVFSLLSYNRLSKKLAFLSFTGLTVKEFDSIYNKEITKRYDKHDTGFIIKKEKKLWRRKTFQT